MSKPTEAWVNALNAILMVYDSGTEGSREKALAELQRMAQAADLAGEAVGKMREMTAVKPNKDGSITIPKQMLLRLLG